MRLCQRLYGSTVDAADVIMSVFWFLSRCGDDSTVELEGNGVQTSNSFSFNLFQFTGKSGKINLNCEVELCLPEEEQCDPVRGVEEVLTNNIVKLNSNQPKSTHYTVWFLSQYYS